MRKLATAVLAILFVFAVAGCKSGKEKQEVKTPVKTFQKTEKEKVKSPEITEGQCVEEPEQEATEEVGEEETSEEAEKENIPKLLSGEMPKYPADIQKGNLTGRVVLEIKVMPNGTVEDVKVVQFTYDRFKEPALQAVKGWRFEPQGTEVELRVSFIFDPEGVKVNISPVLEGDTEGGEI